MDKGKLSVANLALVIMLILALFVGSVSIRVLKETKQMRIACEGKFGYADVGSGLEPLCIYNGVPLYWSGSSWAFEKNKTEGAQT